MKQHAENSFAVMRGVGWRMPRPSRRLLPAWQFAYKLLALWRRVRTTRAATRLLGPQYKRSRDLIEIDITYACNLHCLNCNRSVVHAKEALHMTVEQVRSFVDESNSRHKRWRRIRVLGGEPTLHPSFKQIIEELGRYHAGHPDCIVEVVTNGYGEHVNQALARLPGWVWVDNTRKTSPVQPQFGPFNMAPCDDPAFRTADFSNGCVVQRDCGMGLTPLGFYPCAVAGGVDRVLGQGLGRPQLPDDSDDMLDAVRALCRLCGRFGDGHFVPRALRPPLVENRISPAWENLYASWSDARAAAQLVRRADRHEEAE